MSSAGSFEQAVSLHEQGRLPEAAQLYEAVLAAEADHFDALCHLGVLEAQRGRPDQALDLLQRAVARDPDSAEALNQLGSVLQALGRHGEAIAYHERALAIEPDYPAASYDLGNALQKVGRHEDAVAAYRKAIAGAPAIAEMHYNLGTAFQALGRRPDALGCYEAALALRPGYARAEIGLAATLLDLGRFAEAVRHYESALALRPGDAGLHASLGHALKGLNRAEAAITQYEAALALAPGDAKVLYSLGNALTQLERIDEAIAHFEAALEIQPDYPEARNNLGTCLLSLGQITDAEAQHRAALALKPDFADTHTNLIFALNFDPSAGMEEQQRERRRWYEQHGRRFAAAIAGHANLAEPERRLRLGYVSGHFRHQAATYAFAPVVLGHDRARFEVFCYSDTRPEDDLTLRFRRGVDGWRSVAELSDADLAAMIRADGIDILVDLAGHMSGNRLPVFARKPAPVQATGWGEPTGTGLATMDCLFADPVLVPQPMRPLLTERVVDLPCFLHYWMPEPLPEPGLLPALAKGYVTFGSFNRTAKLSDAVLRAWAAILHAVPRSRIVLKDRALGGAAQRRRIGSTLLAAGIAPERIELIGASGRMAHFMAYRAIDIALDPFPHGGGMTTLDALAMGVPVVTAPGETISSRLAAASLGALGLDELVAPDQAGAGRLAAALAADLPRLAAFRQSLRRRLALSPIGDAAQYTRAVEAAYRGLWREWCARVGRR